MFGSEDLIEDFAAEFRRELARLRKERHGTERRHVKELQTVERGIKRCLNFITSGDGEPGLVRDQLQDLEARKRALEAGLKHGHSEVTIDVQPNLAELYRRKVRELQKLLDDETARPQAMEIIRSLIERIDVYPTKERGQCDVVMVGALAQILAFAHQKMTAASSSGDDGTFLMVAGAGFEPATFRL